MRKPGSEGAPTQQRSTIGEDDAGGQDGEAAAAAKKRAATKEAARRRGRARKTAKAVQRWRVLARQRSASSGGCLARRVLTQRATPARPTSTGSASPDGIGKRYLGREIAQRDGLAGRGLARARRARAGRAHRPARRRSFDSRRAWQVADVGAGTGYVSRRLARRSARRARSFAVDVQPEMIRMLDRARRARPAAADRAGARPGTTCGSRPRASTSR